MTLPTHIAFASVLYLGGATLFGYKPDMAGWLIAAVFSLLPDVDLPSSRIGRLFWFLSAPLERRFGHRTLTHSLLTLTLLAVVTYPLTWIQFPYWGCAVGGYGSHLWLDMLNVRGVDLFWPSPLRLVTPGNRNWRFVVGNQGEMVLLAVLLTLTAALYPLSQIGFRDALQRLLQNFDIAREQYQRQAGTHWYALELEATDNLTLQAVKGTFPIVGIWQNGLILQREGQLQTVGMNSTQHPLYPLKARLVEGEPLRVQSVKVEMAGRTLRGLLSRLDTHQTYYLLGELEMTDGKTSALVSRLENLERYNPAHYSGGILSLHYTRAQELGPWLDRVVIRGEVIVQFWLKPGEAAVALGAGEEQEVERIPVQLRRFLGSKG